MASCVYNGTTSTFTYGADGLRRRMVVGANTTEYLLDGQNVVREIKNGQVDAFYLMGPRGPEYRRDGAGNVQWYLYDGLGSVVATVDSAGNVLDARKYDVYGAVRAGGAGTRHKFCGSLGHVSDDETGLIYMRARHMDPTIGRFISEDPARDGANWFAYCRVNPANFVDPDGRVIWGVVGLVGLLLGSVLAEVLKHYEETVAIAVYVKYAAILVRFIGAVLLVYDLGATVASIAIEYISRFTELMKTSSGPGSLEERLLGREIELTYWAFTDTDYS